MLFDKQYITKQLKWTLYSYKSDNKSDLIA